MSVPALHTPAEVLDISPEALEVANVFLNTQNIKETADTLGISTDLVSSFLDRKEVRAYVNSVFMNVGFNNKFKFRELLDEIIKKKLQDMDDADLGSNKDILEIMTLSHKFTMEQMAMEIKLKELEKKDSIKNQTNVQINNNAGNYSTLLEKLLNGSLHEGN